MVKRKRNRNRGKPPVLVTSRDKEAEDQRLKLLAMEIYVAAAQTLQEKFEFSEADVQRWFDLTMERAKDNRTAIGVQIGIQMAKLFGDRKES